MHRHTSLIDISQVLLQFWGTFLRNQNRLLFRNKLFAQRSRPPSRPGDTIVERRFSLRWHRGRSHCYCGLYRAIHPFTCDDYNHVLHVELPSIHIYIYIYIYMWVLKAPDIIHNSPDTSKLPDSLMLVLLQKLLRQTHNNLIWSKYQKSVNWVSRGSPFCLFPGLFF